MSTNKEDIKETCATTVLQNLKADNDISLQEYLINLTTCRFIFDFCLYYESHCTLL